MRPLLINFSSPESWLGELSGLSGVSTWEGTVGCLLLEFMVAMEFSILEMGLGVGLSNFTLAVGNPRYDVPSVEIDSPGFVFDEESSIRELYSTVEAVPTIFTVIRDFCFLGRVKSWVCYLSSHCSDVLL